MAYRITGLDRAPFEPLIGASDDALAAVGAVRMTATAQPGFPCRVTLEDAAPGETLILVNHVSHDVETPYRTAYAIFVREKVHAPAQYVDALPPVMAGRTLSLRGFDAAGMLCAATLAMPGEVEAQMLDLFADPDIASIHAHNAAYGCFLARIDRN